MLYIKPHKLKVVFFYQIVIIKLISDIRTLYLGVMITLETRQLTKRFGPKSVFNDVNIHFTGAILGIGGPNGSGKSTLLKCLAGLLRPSAGEIAWDADDKRISGPMLRKDIGYAAPYLNHYAELTVDENLAFVARLRSLEKARERIGELLRILDIHHQKNVSYGSLSSGQQQRVKLAAALLGQPRVLFLDEPGTNLDKKGNQIVNSLVMSFLDRGGTVILASNNEGELDLCEQVYTLDA